MKNFIKGLQTEIDTLKLLVSDLKTLSNTNQPEIDNILVNIQQALSKLCREEARICHLLDSTAIAFWEWNIKTGETIFNERWADIIGFKLEDISPVSIDTWLDHAHPEDLKESDQLLKAYWRGESDFYVYESRMKHKQGHWVWVLDTAKVTEWDEQGEPLKMIGTHVDISAQKLDQKALIKAKAEAEKAVEELTEQAVQLQSEVAQRRDMQGKLDHMAKYDALTNLPNRTLLFHQAEKVLASARRYGHNVAIMFIDFDGFKAVNDNNDHKVGDSVLVEMSLRLLDVIREVDTVSRIGGDEFVVLLSNWNERSDIETIANRLLMAIKQPIESINVRESLSASIGIAVYPDDAHYFKELLTLADRAMYSSKQAGKDQYCFTS